ncbi:MAG TPA: type II toxin-antitoxin system VapC family toxin [Gammaproteobacteria bacterium]
MARGATDIFRRLERTKKITSLEAAAAHRDLTNLDIAVYAFAPVAERVWQLRHALTSYDAWYVAVAEAVELPLAAPTAPRAHSFCRRGTDAFTCQPKQFLGKFVEVPRPKPPP